MFVLSSWMVPEYDALDPGMVEESISEELYYRMFPWASGNLTTCHLQGAVLYFAQVLAVWFTGAISLQYILTVAYKWPQDRMDKFEKIAFAWTFLYAFASTVAISATDSLGATSMGYCWIAQTPWYCDQFYCGDIYADFDPEQSQIVYAFRMSAIAVVCLNFAVILISMVTLFCTVRRQERRAAQWSHTAAQGNSQKKVVYKAIFLIGVYILLYFPSFLSLFLEPMFPQSISVAMALTIPCQGFFNALIYSDKMTKVAFSRIALVKRMSRWTKRVSWSLGRPESTNPSRETNNSSTISSTIDSSTHPPTSEAIHTLSRAFNLTDDVEDNPNADQSAAQVVREEENLVVDERGSRHQENTHNKRNPSVTFVLEKEIVENGSEEEAVDS